MHGLLLLNKPTGITSNAALSRVKRVLRTKSAGFAGTLDPMATGVLPIALGEATKCLPYIEDVDKSYEFTVRWGIATDTLDTEGKMIAENPVRPTENNIKNILPQFTGQISQIPPAFSAIKINGQRAYDLARAGEAPEMKARIVTIHALELVEIASADHATFRVTCSKGTYIRSLAQDMAYALGALGHLTGLTRTRSGKFVLADCIWLDDLLAMNPDAAAEQVLSIPRMLMDLPHISPDMAELQRLQCGQPILLHESNSFVDLHLPGSAILIVNGEAAFGIGVVKIGNQLWPRRVFVY